MTDLHLGDRLERVRAIVDGWADGLAESSPAIAAVDRGTSDDTSLGEPRWYVRMLGEEKDTITVWLTLGQRTLRFESYVLPAPEEHGSEVNELLLRRNASLVGARFAIGAEDAIYVMGELPDAAVDDHELDRVLGTVYTAIEENFRALVRLAFASRFAAG